MKSVLALCVLKKHVSKSRNVSGAVVQLVKCLPRLSSCPETMGSAEYMVVMCNPSTGVVHTGGILGSLAKQLSLMYEPQTNERPHQIMRA